MDSQTARLVLVRSPWLSREEIGIDGDVGRAASAYSTMICMTIFGVFWIDMLGSF